jgi:hypothetical protein
LVLCLCDFCLLSLLLFGITISSEIFRGRDCFMDGLRDIPDGLPKCVSRDQNCLYNFDRRSSSRLFSFVMRKLGKIFYFLIFSPHETRFATHGYYVSHICDQIRITKRIVMHDQLSHYYPRVLEVLFRNTKCYCHKLRVLYDLVTNAVLPSCMT